jgi:hypothetical protein
MAEWWVVEGENILTGSTLLHGGERLVLRMVTVAVARAGDDGR